MELESSNSSVPQKARGAFIVIEGLDRAGKSSQCELLYQSLLSGDIPARYVKFPGTENPAALTLSPDEEQIGAHRRDDHSIHLIFSANRWEAMDGILADIEKGVTVIIDRYSYSGAVYSAAKENPNLDLDWAWAPEIGLPQPDLCFFLSIKPHEAAKRGGFGEERYETQQMQLRVRRLFTELFDRTQPSDSRICLIDAGKLREEVAANIFQQVSSFLNGLRKQNRPETLSRLGPLGPLTKDRPNLVAFS